VCVCERESVLHVQKSPGMLVIQVCVCARKRDTGRQRERVCVRERTS